MCIRSNLISNLNIESNMKNIIGITIRIRIHIDIRIRICINININNIIMFLTMQIYALVLLNGYASAAGPFFPPMIFVTAFLVTSERCLEGGRDRNGAPADLGSF